MSEIKKATPQQIEKLSSLLEKIKSEGNYFDKMIGTFTQVNQILKDVDSSSSFYMQVSTLLVSRNNRVPNQFGSLIEILINAIDYYKSL